MALFYYFSRHFRIIPMTQALVTCQFFRHFPSFFYGMDACVPCLVPMMLVGTSSYQRWWAAAAIYPENGWLNICIWIFLLLLLQLLVAHFEMMPTGHSCNDLLDHHAPAQKWNFLFWCKYFFKNKILFPCDFLYQKIKAVVLKNKFKDTLLCQSIISLV